MDYLSVASLLTVFTCLVTGLFVYLYPPRNLLKSLWALICLITGLMGFGIYHKINAVTFHEAYQWSLRSNAISCFIPVFFFHFTLLLTGREHRKNRELTGYYAVTLIYVGLALLFPGAFVRTVAPKLSFSYYSVPGPLFYFFPLWLMYLMSYGLYFVFRSFKSASMIKRNQLKYFMVGMSLGVLGGIAALLPCFDILIPPVGVFLIPVCMVIVGYAIAKHQLLDIRIAFRQSLVYSFLVSCISILGIMLVILSQEFFQKVLGYNSFWGSIWAALFIAILLIPFMNTLQSWIQTLIYKRHLTQMAEENVVLRQEMVAMARHKSISEILQFVCRQMEDPISRLKGFNDNVGEKIMNPGSASALMSNVMDQVQQLDAVFLHLKRLSQPISLTPKKHNFVVLLSGFLSETGAWLDKKKIRVFKYYTEKDVFMVLADEELIKSVLTAIFQFAAETMPDGGELHIGMERNAEWMELSIKDAGCGLSAEELNNVYSPFFQTDRIRGGLAYTRVIVQEHGGKIRIESEPASGTEYFIELPLIT